MSVLAHEINTSRGTCAPSGRAWLEERKNRTLLLGLIVVAGVGIRLYCISDRSMWFDEASSWRTSQFHIPKMFASIAQNDHVPLYYILLKIWTGIFGDSLVSMRGLSVLFAGIAMVGVYLFSIEAFGLGTKKEVCESNGFAPWIGLFAAALVAVSLLQIRSAWEVRMYTLGTALTALSSWTLFRALRCGNSSWKPWALHAIVTVLLAYTHHFALFTIAGQVLFLIGFFLIRANWRLLELFSDRQLRAAVVSYLAVALGWSLWLPILLRQMKQVQAEYWTGHFGVWSVLNRCYEMFMPGPATRASAAIAAAACVAVLLILLWRNRPAHWYVFLVVVMPFVCATTLSSAGRNVMVIRYLLFAHLFLLVGIAAATASIPDLRFRNAAALLLLLNGAAIFIDSSLSLNIRHKPGMKAAVAYIESTRHPEEQVIVCSPLLYFPAYYHFRDRSACRVYTEGSPFSHHRGGPITIPSDLISFEQIGKIGPGRVWLIGGGWSPVAVPIPRYWQRGTREVFKEVYSFQGSVTVEIFVVPPTLGSAKSGGEVTP